MMLTLSQTQIIFSAFCQIPIELYITSNYLALISNIQNICINKTNMQIQKSISTQNKTPLPRRILKSQVKYYSVPSSPFRHQCIDWLYNGQSKLHFSRSTLFIAFGLLDKLLIKGLKLAQTNYELVGAVLLLISTKFNEVYPASIANLNNLCKDEYSVRQFIEAQAVILQNINYTVQLEPIYEELVGLESLYEGKQGQNVKELIKMAVMNPNETFRFGSTSLIQAVERLSFQGRLFEIQQNNSDQDSEIQFIKSQFNRLRSTDHKKLVDPIHA